jgi:hypothetical protein
MDVKVCGTWVAKLRDMNAKLRDMSAKWRDMGG